MSNSAGQTTCRVSMAQKEGMRALSLVIIQRGYEAVAKHLAEKPQVLLIQLWYRLRHN